MFDFKNDIKMKNYDFKSRLLTVSQQKDKIKKLKDENADLLRLNRYLNNQLEQRDLYFKGTTKNR